MKYRQHTIRIPDDLYSKLQELAITERRTLNGQVVAILEERWGASSEVSSKIAMKTLMRQINTEQ